MMSKEGLDPEIYKEIWGEYPHDAANASARRIAGTVAHPDAPEAITEAGLNRENVPAGIEPHLVVIQSRLAEIESRLEGIERELREIGNRGVQRGSGGN